MLKAYGINDVHCEIRETVVEKAAASTLVISALDVSDVALGGSHFTDFTRTIGQSIALERNPDREATLTCYMSLAQERNSDAENYALISRHLVFSEGEGRDDQAYSYTKSSLKHYIIMPGDRTLKEARETVGNDLRSWQDNIVAVCDDATKLQFAKEQLRITKDFQKHLESLEKPESRRIGYVVYSAARLPEAQTNDFGGPDSLTKADWLPDYAIVRLDTGRIESRHTALNNIVYLKDQGDVPKEVNHGLGAANRYQLPENGEPLRIQGVIPTAELYKPTSRYGRRNYTTGDLVLRFGKRGRTTGLTWGQSNQIGSITREDVNGQKVKALHLPALSLGHGVFSAKGDSGAALFTADGHLAAMLDGGSGSGTRLDPFDVTYATPLEWIREHIKSKAFPSASFL